MVCAPILSRYNPMMPDIGHVNEATEGVHNDKLHVGNATFHINVTSPMHRVISRAAEDRVQTLGNCGQYAMRHDSAKLLRLSSASSMLSSSSFDQLMTQCVDANHAASTVHFVTRTIPDY